MDTLLHILIPFVTAAAAYYLGRYAKAKRVKELIRVIEEIKDEHITLMRQHQDRHEDLCKSFDKLECAYLDYQKKAPKVVIVNNINPHQAADKEYVGIYPNNGIKPAHFTVEEYQKGVDRLKDHPEDKAI